MLTDRIAAEEVERLAATAPTLAKQNYEDNLLWYGHPLYPYHIYLVIYFHTPLVVALFVLRTLFT
jgi:hypothetical protein